MTDRERLLEDWLRKIADRLEKSAEILDSDETTRMQRHNYAMMAKTLHPNHDLRNWSEISMIIKPPAWDTHTFTTENLHLFVAGGISECQDWQTRFTESLEDIEQLVMFNPRRDDFDVKNTGMSREQITWEYNALLYSDAVSFWFPDYTIAPITLFELGKELARNSVIFVGMGTAYHRRFDVELQVRLANPSIQIVYTLEDLAQQVREWVLKDG